MDAERDVGLEQRREDVEGEVDLLLVGEVVEDLGLEHVDHAVGQVGERLGGLGLLLEALMRPSEPVTTTPYSVVSVTRLTARVAIHSLSACVRASAGEVDVGERVAGHHHERLVAEERAHVADPARGAEQLLLLAVGELDAELGAVPEPVADRVAEPVQVGDDLVQPVAARASSGCAP